MDKNGVLLAVISCLWDTLLAVVCLFLIHNVIIKLIQKKLNAQLLSHPVDVTNLLNLAFGRFDVYEATFGPTILFRFLN